MFKKPENVLDDIVQKQSLITKPAKELEQLSKKFADREASLSKQIASLQKQSNRAAARQAKLIRPSYISGAAAAGAFAAYMTAAMPLFAAADKLINGLFAGTGEVAKTLKENPVSEAQRRAAVSAELNKAADQFTNETMPKVAPFKDAEFKQEYQRLDSIRKNLEEERAYRQKYDAVYTFFVNTQFRLAQVDDFWANVWGMEVPDALTRARRRFWGQDEGMPKNQNLKTLESIVRILRSTDRSAEAEAKALEAVNLTFQNVPNYLDNKALQEFRERLIDEIKKASQIQDREERVRKLNEFLEQCKFKDPDSTPLNNQLQNLYRQLNTAFKDSDKYLKFVEDLQALVGPLYKQLDELEAKRSGTLPSSYKETDERIKQLRSLGNEMEARKLELQRQAQEKKQLDDAQKNIGALENKVEEKVTEGKKNLGIETPLTDAPKEPTPWAFWVLTGLYAVAAAGLIHKFIQSPLSNRYDRKTARLADRVTMLDHQAGEQMEQLDKVRRGKTCVDLALAIKTRSYNGAEVPAFIRKNLNELDQSVDDCAADIYRYMNSTKATYAEFVKLGVDFILKHADSAVKADLKREAENALKSGNVYAAYNALETAFSRMKPADANQQTLGKLFQEEFEKADKSFHAIAQMDAEEQKIYGKLHAAMIKFQKGDSVFAGADIEQTMREHNAFLVSKKNAVKGWSEKLEETYNTMKELYVELNGGNEK